MAAFSALTFLFGWAAPASLIAFGGLLEPFFGTHPVFVLAIYSPEFAAI